MSRSAKAQWRASLTPPRAQRVLHPKGPWALLPWLHPALVCLALVGTPACKGDKGSTKDVKDAPGKAAARSPEQAPPAPLSPRIAWRTPFGGRLHTLAVVQDVVIVASRKRGDLSAARRLAGFNAKDGRLLWQRPLRMRYFDPGAFFSTSHGVAEGVLAVATSGNRVQGLDPRTGTKLWQHSSPAGVVAAGKAFALGRPTEVVLVEPRSGKMLRRQDLALPESGAPGNGLMDHLLKGTRLAALPGGILFHRRHGGALQALASNTLKARWLLDPEGSLHTRPERLAAGASTLLVPVLYPKRVEETELRAFTRDLTGGDQNQGTDATASPPPTGTREHQKGLVRWKATVPGRISIRRLWLSEDQVFGLSRATNRQTLLWRVNRKNGTLVDARPFPSPHFCLFGAGLLVCKHAREVAAYDPETLDRRWTYEPGAGRNILSARLAGELLVMECGGDLVAKHLADGRSVMEVPMTLEGQPYRVEAALGTIKNRLLIAARHSADHGDRLVLLSLNLATGKPSYVHPLGRYPRPDSTRPAWMQEDEKLPGSLPLVWIPASPQRPARVLSLFGQTFQVVEAETGKTLLARGMPGDADSSPRLLRQENEAAIIKRGTTLFAVSLSDHRVLWQASLFRARMELATHHRAFVSRRGRVTDRTPGGRTVHLYPPRAPDPVAAGVALVQKESCDLRFASETRWLCQNEANLLVIDAEGGQVLAKLPRASNVISEDGQLLSTHPHWTQGERTPAWLALDVTTGKERWRQETAPRGQSTAQRSLPPPFPREQARPARWMTALGEHFVVTDEAGACVVGVEQETGRRAFGVCFQALAGPPMAHEGKLLLTAQSAQASKGRAGHKAPGSAAPGSGHYLHLVDPATGDARVLHSPETGKSLVLGSAPPSGDRLFLTIHPDRGSFTRNEVIGLDLR